MGQRSEPAIWSTRGGLRWSKEGKYKEEKPHYRGVERKNTINKKNPIIKKGNIKKKDPIIEEKKEKTLYTPEL